MYIVLGGDGKEYGPVSAEQIQDWLRERRVDTNTKIKQEGGDAWKTVADFPELASLADSLTMRTNMNTPEDYSINIGDCFKRGWALVIANPFLTIVGTVLITIASILINVPSWVGSAIAQMGGGGVVVKIISAILSLSSAILAILFQGVIYAGFYYFFIRLIRGETPAVMDVFEGFKRNFVQLVIGGAVMTLMIGLGLILCIIPGVYLGVSYLFALPLIIDKDMGFWDAMELSRQTIGKHFFSILLFIILMVIVMLLGLIGCIVGVFFTVPIAIAAMIYAYEDIFKS